MCLLEILYSFVIKQLISETLDQTLCPHNFKNKNLGPVAQSIVSLTSSCRGQLVKCLMTLYSNTLIFFVEKVREAFALQKLQTFFQQKILAYITVDINV